MAIANSTLPGFLNLELLAETRNALLVRGLAGDRPVLLRFPHSPQPSPEEIARLRYDFELSSQVNSPHVVKVHGLEQHGTRTVLIMEDFGARPLRGLLAEGELGLSEVLQIALHIARALGDLHTRHIIHKHIEPANIYVNRPAGEAKLANLSHASRLMREPPRVLNLEQLDDAAAYISPEQTGRMNRDVDYRTDLYSLGVTLYEMLTGRLPFEGNDPMVLVHGHIAVVPRAPHLVRPTVPRAVSDIVMKLLAKNAEERYQSAYGLVADLEACLAQLGTIGTIADFAPGRQDVSARFQLPQKLYGREAERAALIEAFEHASTGGTTLFLVAGHSGIGKSTLINEIQKPVIERRGYFCAGKYDLSLGMPYSGLVEALRGLLRQILAETDEHIERWRQRFLDAFSSNGQIVIDVIPEVELVVGRQPPATALGPTESQKRFQLVFSRFIEAFARPEHPVAMFLDDLQNADAASIELLRYLMQNPSGRHLLVIGAYRENELHGAHPLTAALAELHAAGARVQAVSLRPLAPRDMEQLVADTVGASPSDAAPRELAALVLQRTEGNPFFASQFLLSLHEHELITFDAQTGRWQWDPERIRAAPISDNIARLIAEKIQMLPIAAQRTLQLAACIGHVFDLHLVAKVAERSPEAAAAELWLATEQGLLRPLGDAYKYVNDGAGASQVQYEFLHDRVQETAGALLSDGEKKHAHLRLGRLLRSSTPPEEREQRVFDIVNHLNYGVEHILDPRERHELAQLNLVAGRRAKSSNAHATAMRYLEQGLALLPPAPWDTAYDLTFALHRHRAECHFLLTQFAEAEAELEALRARARAAAEHDEIYLLRTMLHLSQGQFDAMIDDGREALRSYGLEVPPREALGPTGMAELQALFGRLGSYPIRSVLDRPEAQDPAHRARVRLLSYFIVYIGPARPDLLMWVVPISLRETLEHGPVPGSASAFLSFATMSAGMGNLPFAREFGDVGQALSEKYDERAARAMNLNIYVAFIRPWLQPTSGCLPSLDRAYAELFELGMLGYAGFVATTRTVLGILAGAPLDELLARAQARLEFLFRSRETDVALLLVVYVRVLTLYRDGRVPDSPEWYDEKYVLARVSNPHARAAVASHGAQLAYHFGDLRAALEYLAQAEPFLPTMAPFVESAAHRFYQALIYAAALPDAPAAERVTWEKAIADHRGQMESLAAACPENFRHRALLLAAEQARLAGEVQKAADLYEEAAEAAGQTGILQERALACELAARLHLGRGKRTLARAYLGEARDAWERWGAHAKVARLEKDHPDLLPPRERTAHADPTSLDLLTVMKASQAISGEIVLDNLLRQLMTTMLENAGAQHGQLLLASDIPITVEAEAGTEAVPVVRYGGSIERQAGAGASIIRYVERTGETLVLGDACRAGPFAGDPAVVVAGLRSVLCMPIRKQNATVGILYLENRLIADAFTHERCRVLDLLAAQASISLENARLYDTLENRVRERTRELRDKNDELSQALQRLRETQKQLVLQEKLASLGALTSGIAHEIKNPLNFVNNFAELSIELGGDLQEELTAAREVVPAARRESIDDIITDMNHNLRKILEHGKRADGIVRAMLEHARAGTGERADVDLNALLSEYARLAADGLRSRIPSEVSLSFDFVPLPTVNVVQGEIGRTVLNLVNNAIYAASRKAQRLGKGQVAEVRISSRDIGGLVEFRVRDNGDGISAAIRDKIFNPFFTTKPTGEGTGLGLSLTHDIVRGHGGTLTVETEEGSYAEFIVRLPPSPT